MHASASHASGPDARDRVVRAESEHERLEMVMRAAGAPLHASIAEYCCYDEARLQTSIHRHLPHPHVTLILSLGGELTVHDPSGVAHGFGEGRGFLAGLHTRPALTSSGPRQRGVQVSLTPTGAHRLLGGVPMDQVTNRVFDLGDLIGVDALELGAQLCEAPGTDAAFRTLEAFFQARILDGRADLPPEIAFACRLLDESRGSVRIRDIAEQLGWTRKRLVKAFRERVGVPPKAFARILRFDRAMELMKRDPALRWSDAALVCGYADQAHLSREVRDLADATPRDLLRHLLPQSGGITADSGPEAAETK